MRLDGVVSDEAIPDVRDKIDSPPNHKEGGLINYSDPLELTIVRADVASVLGRTVGADSVQVRATSVTPEPQWEAREFCNLDA